MPFLRPTHDRLQQEVQQDIQNASLPGLNAVVPGGFVSKIAGINVGLAQGMYGYIDYIAQQTTPATATGAELEAWGLLKGVARKDASQASGVVKFTGLANVVISSGAVLALGSDNYIVQDTVTISNLGVATSNVTSAAYGLSANVPTGTFLRYVNPSVGADSTAEVVGEVTGGTDIETVEAYRSRILKRYQEPPQGGAITDYEQWATELPGVTRAWCAPVPDGPGTVTVYFMMDVTRAAFSGRPQGTDGYATDETRSNVTATGDQLYVANELHPLRPATALVKFKAPTLHAVNVTIDNLTLDNDAARSSINDNLDELFLQKGSALGTTLELSDFYNAIDSATGVNRFTITSPTSSVSIPAGSVPVRGSISFT